MRAPKPVDLSRDDDDVGLVSRNEAKTVPPPSGAKDAYSAETVVKEMVPELLRQARDQAAADGALTGASSASLNATSSAAPSTLPKPARRPPVAEAPEADGVVDIVEVRVPQAARAPVIAEPWLPRPANVAAPLVAPAREGGWRTTALVAVLVLVMIAAIVLLASAR